MNKITLITTILFVIVAVAYIQSGKKRALAKREFLKNEGGLAIGVFESRNYSNGRTYSVSFSYTINGKNYSNGEFYSYLDSPLASDAFINKKLARRKDKFLVLYNKENPKESIIRLDYPIKDSADFKKYVKEFEQMRK